MNQTIETFTNETILYNEQYHAYYTVDGKKLLGASSYAKRFGDTFNADAIIPRLVDKWQLPSGDIKQLWAINADISNNFGSAVHSAMELWFRYHKAGAHIQSLKDLEHNYALPKNAHLRDIVLSFVNQFGDIDGVPEATLSAVAKGMAGRTDLIHLTGEKVCRVGDYKTNNDLDRDKLLKYQHQLSFYADILVHHGWTVEGLDIYHHDGKRWTHIPMEVLPVELTPVSTGGRRPPAF
jgi:hypothetical protein